MRRQCPLFLLLDLPLPLQGGYGLHLKVLPSTLDPIDPKDPIGEKRFILNLSEQILNKERKVFTN